MKYSLDTIKVSKKKTKALIISGLHGNETDAVRSTMDLKALAQKNPEEFGKSIGEITFLIGVNEAGLRHRMRETAHQYDGSDLNRLFYQEEDYRGLLAGLIEKADVVIDVHNSPMIANCVLLNFDENAPAWRKHFGQLGVQTLTWVKPTPTVKNYVNGLRGKKGFTVELNGLGFEGNHPANVQFLKQAALAAFTSPSEKSAPSGETVMVEVTSRFEGMLRWFPETLGHRFNKGDVIASVSTFDNDLLCDLVAPVDGVLVTGPESCFVNYGETVFGMDPA